jgi:hypothetical protein
MSTLSQKSARVYVGFVELAGIWRAKGAFGGNAGLQPGNRRLFLHAMQVDHDACVFVLV